MTPRKKRRKTPEKITVYLLNDHPDHNGCLVCDDFSDILGAIRTLTRRMEVGSSYELSITKQEWTRAAYRKAGEP